MVRRTRPRWFTWTVCDTGLDYEYAGRRWNLKIRTRMNWARETVSRRSNEQAR